VDPAALRTLLEQQVAQLAPIEQNLLDCATHPPIAPTDWHGPASSSYAELQARLLTRVALCWTAVSAAIASSRQALGELGDLDG
jgi:hypothetical protein